MQVHAVSALFVAALSVLVGCGDAAGPSAPSVPSEAGGRIEVVFKVDPRIARGTYLGDRWIAPPYVRVGEGPQVTVEARAEVLDAAGGATTVAPAWRSFDPGMVTVTPQSGNDVEITVGRAGQTRVDVTAPGVVKRLLVSAAYPNGVIQVQISEQ